MLTKTLLLLVIILALAAPFSAQADCQAPSHPDDYAVTYTYHDGYTWARVWYGGHATTIQGTAGRQIGNSGGTTTYTAPDGQLVLVGDYPSEGYDEPLARDSCGSPVDETADAFPIETRAFDEATGLIADVYIFTDDFLGERTQIPASIDSAGAVRLILQVDQWRPGQAYALLVDGVYRGRVTLGETFSLIIWEAALW